MQVLVVDDDPLCLMVLERMLKRCQYKVTTSTCVASALQLLRENKDNYDLVLSDVYMPDNDGFKLLEIVGLELDLPVIMMSANGETSVVMKGITHGACDYLIKPIRMEELKTIWQHVVRRKGKEPPNGDPMEDFMEGANMDGGTKKRKEQLDECINGDPLDPDINSLKKARVNWSAPLHEKFVMAVNELGVDKAVPKKILELMDVPGLTREHVASHLQKYRLTLKRLSGRIIQQPAPVATFQASNDGSGYGGVMRVELRPNAIASTGMKHAKGLNFGGGMGKGGGGLVSGDACGMEAVARMQMVTQPKMGANRAQVLGGLGIGNAGSRAQIGPNAKSGGVLQRSGGSDSLAGNYGGNMKMGGGEEGGGLFKMASLDIGLLLKMLQEEGEMEQQRDAMDDLTAATFSSKNAFKGDPLFAPQRDQLAPRTSRTPIAGPLNIPMPISTPQSLMIQTVAAAAATTTAAGTALLSSRRGPFETEELTTASQRSSSSVSSLSSTMASYSSSYCYAQPLNNFQLNPHLEQTLPLNDFAQPSDFFNPHHLNPQPQQISINLSNCENLGPSSKNLGPSSNTMESQGRKLSGEFRMDQSLERYNYTNQASNPAAIRGPNSRPSSSYSLYSSSCTPSFSTSSSSSPNSFDQFNPNTFQTKPHQDNLHMRYPMLEIDVSDYLLGDD